MEYDYIEYLDLLYCIMIILMKVYGIFCLFDYRIYKKIYYFNIFWL